MRVTAPGAPLEVTEVPDPKAEPGEVVVRVKNCGICGSDLHAAQWGVLRSPKRRTFLAVSQCATLALPTTVITGRYPLRSGIVVFAGRKNGSFVPHTRDGGRRVRKYSWNFG